MNTVDTRPERNLRREKLKAIRKRIGKLGPGYLRAEDLETTGIQHRPMSLEEEKLLPRFFKPYQAEVQLSDDEYVTEDLPIPDEEAEALTLYLDKSIDMCELPQEDQYPMGPQYRDYGDFNFGLLLDTRNRPSWQVEAAWDMKRRDLPHIKCMMLTHADYDERLLQGEILTIIDIMRKRLRTKSLRPHINAPVLMYSFFGLSVRVLEASFNGQQELVVRATKPYDFKNEDENYTLTLLFVRWWLGHATDEPTTL